VPFKNRHNLERHFVRHGQEFGAATASEYEKKADAFMTQPLHVGILECHRRIGDCVRFSPKTNEFGVCTSNGEILTFMIITPLAGSAQTALQYYESACKK
jgi:pyocin large subunit-like protein